MRKSFFLTILIFMGATGYAQKENYKLLWKVSGNGFSAPSYVFGSMHVMDNKAFELPDTLFSILQTCDVVALEFNPDSILIQSSLDELIGQGNTSSKTGGSFLNKDRSTFLDGYLYTTAMRMGLESRSLEQDVATQFNALDEDTSEAGIFASLISQHRLVEVYRNGDIDSLARMFPKSLNDSLLVYRNTDMVKSIERIGAQRSLFAVAGALHLPGEYGLINQLKEKGYHVELVTSEFSGKFEEYEKDLPSLPWREFYIESMGIKGLAPVFPVKLKNYPVDALMSMDFQNLQVMFTLRIFNQSNVQDPIELMKLFNAQFAPESSVEDIVEGEDGKGRMYLETISTIAGNEAVVRLQMVDGEVILHMIMAFNQLDEVSANLYFDNLEYNAIPFETDFDKWFHLNDTVGAYSVSFPKEPLNYKKKNIDEEVDNYVEELYLNYVAAGGFTYLVRYSDYPPGYIVESDSFALRAIFKGFPDQFGTDSTKVNYEWIDGYKAISGGVVNANTTSWTKAFFRGNRYYLLMVLGQGQHEGEPANVTNFFDSFDTQSFVPYKNRKYDKALSPIEFDVFGRLQVEGQDTGFYWDSYTTSETFYCKDSLSGTDLTIGVETSKKYVQYTDTTVFSLINQLMEQGDSIILDTVFEHQGGKMFQREVVNSGYSTSKLFNLFLIGDQLVNYNLTYPKELNGRKVYGDLILSMTYTGSVAGDHLFIDKKHMLMEDLYSKDTTVFNEAINAFNYIDVVESDAKLMIGTALENQEKGFHPDSANFALISNFTVTEDSSNEVFNALTMLYDSASDDNVRYAALLYATQYDPRNGALLFYDVLKEKDLPKPSYIFEGLYQSVNVDYLFDSLGMEQEFLERIVPYSQNPYYSELFIQAASQVALDSNALELLLPYREDVLFNLKRGISEVNEEGSYGYSSRLFALSDVAMVYKDEESKEVMVNVMNSDAYPYIKVHYINYFEAFPKEVEKVWVDSIIKYPSVELDFYSNIYETSLERFFPKKKRKQDYIAKLRMSYYLDWYWDEYIENVDQIEILERVELDEYGIEGVAFICSFKLDYYDEVYMGISGIQPLNKKEISFDRDYNFTDFDEYDRYEYQSQRIELINALVEEYLAGLED